MLLKIDSLLELGAVSPYQIWYYSAGLRVPSASHMKKKNIRFTVDWCTEENIHPGAREAAIKRIFALQIEEAMIEQDITKAEMARRMGTSRAALHRLLDPYNEAVTLSTLRKAAKAVGRELRLELV
jgi:antitoxin HicB